MLQHPRTAGPSYRSPQPALRCTPLLPPISSLLASCLQLGRYSELSSRISTITHWEGAQLLEHHIKGKPELLPYYACTSSEWLSNYRAVSSPLHSSALLKAYIEIFSLLFPPLVPSPSSSSVHHGARSLSLSVSISLSFTPVNKESHQEDQSHLC